MKVGYTQLPTKNGKTLTPYAAIFPNYGLEARRGTYSFKSSMKLSQRVLADKEQLMGIDIVKNAIQQIESSERFVTDIELKVFAELFKITADEILRYTSF